MLYSCINNIKWNENRLAIVNMTLPPLWITNTLNSYEPAVNIK